ncbi:hypothetical protein B0T19DRAFT_445374 [Cercophora scortea]|uniref:Alcohol dehydrogenase n=1 Tax=Cercophora scortea TaxID=314031 RepID=A0AAE0I6N3_9PEZI|nr:hypothetical protein B0T19DRAFT_445374 [Cercophora scortea]
MAGIVHAVGKDVYEFKPGDRVRALHEYGEENGSFAKYAVAPDWTTFHLSEDVSFQEATTVPTAALTAAIALFADVKLPTPYDVTAVSGEVAKRKSPFLIMASREDSLVAAVGEIFQNEGLGNKIPMVFDATSEMGSHEAITRLLDPNGGTMCTVLPPELCAKDKESLQ